MFCSYTACSILSHVILIRVQIMIEHMLNLLEFPMALILHALLSVTLECCIAQFTVEM